MWAESHRRSAALAAAERRAEQMEAGLESAEMKLARQKDGLRDAREEARGVGRITRSCVIR